MERQKLNFDINLFIFFAAIVIFAAIYINLFIELNHNIDAGLYFEDFYAQYEAAKDYKVFFRPYPPSTSLIYLPFTKISYKKAADLFYLFNISVLSLIFYLAGKIINFRSIKAWNILIFFGILFFPFYNSIEFGQINALILLVTTAVIKIDISEKLPPALKNCLIGFFISTGSALKFFPAILLLFFIFKKRYSVIFYFIVFILFWICMSSIFFGWEVWVYFITKVIPITSKSWVILTVNNQSLLSLLTRLLGHSLEGGKTPLFYLPYLIKPLYFTIVLFFLLIYSFFFFKSKDALTQYSITLLTGILIFGLNWHHTFSFVFFPVIYYFYTLKDKRSLNLAVWSIGFFLMILNIDFSCYDIKGFLHFMTIPSYYGSLIILILYYRKILFQRHQF